MEAHAFPHLTNQPPRARRSNIALGGAQPWPITMPPDAVNSLALGFLMSASASLPPSLASRRFKHGVSCTA